MDLLQVAGFDVLLAVGAAGSLAGILLTEPHAARFGSAAAIRLAVTVVTLAMWRYVLNGMALLLLGDREFVLVPGEALGA